MTAIATPAGPAVPEVPDERENCGLRERKKRETRRAIYRAALGLAHELGYDAVTVDAIAERAGISPRTFFNYYASKEDAIVGVDPDDAAELTRAVLARPADERVRQVVRQVVLERIGGLEKDPAAWAMRRRVALAEPAIGVRMLGVGARADRVLVDACIERARVLSGGELSPDAELAVSVEAFAAIGAIRAAVRTHANADYVGPLADVVDRAYDLL